MRERWRRIIFDHDTPLGRAFDVALIIAILGSVFVMMLDGLPKLSVEAHVILRRLEWGFTILFTVEYFARLWCAVRPLQYARSFFGVVDLLATLPTYISLFFPGGRFLGLVRILRVMRVFRILVRVHEYPGLEVLGDRHAHDGRVRRHRAHHGDRTAARERPDDPRLRHHRGADGHHDVRDPARDAGRRTAAGGVLLRLRPGRS